MSETDQSPEGVSHVFTKRRARFSWRSMAFSLFVLALALWFSDPERVLRQLSKVNPWWLVPCFAVASLQLTLLGLRWSHIARALGVELGFVRATLEYALSVALNLVLPSGFAGDGLRAYRHHRLVPGPGALRIVEALALDRLSGQFALGLVVLGGLPLGASQAIFEFSSIGIVLLSVLSLVAFAFVLSRRVRRLRALAVSLGRLAARALRVLFAPRSLCVHLPLSLLFTLASVTQLYIASRALGVSLGIVELGWAGPLILLAASLPSFFGGWGVREGASGVVFAALNLAPATGVAVSVVYGVFGLIVHLPGLLVLLMDTHPPPPTADPEGSR